MRKRCLCMLLIACLFVPAAYGQARAERTITDRNGVALTGNPAGEASPLPQSIVDAMDAVLLDRFPNDDTRGMDVQLTVDHGLQRTAMDALHAAFDQGEGIASGSIVVMDLQGRVLAMASLDNTGTQEVNHAIQTRGTPGETILPATALAALDSEALVTYEQLSDQGAFPLYNLAHPAHCWIDPGKIGRHADMTIAEGIAHQCYYMFYELAARIGADGNQLHDFYRDLGLTGLTNIELAGETESFLGHQGALYDPARVVQLTTMPDQVHEHLLGILSASAAAQGMDVSDAVQRECAEALMQMAYHNDTGYDYEQWKASAATILEQYLGFPGERARDADLMAQIMPQLAQIKWGGSHTIEAAIGQSISQTTPIAMARYMAAVSGGGRVYDARIVKEVSENGESLLRYLDGWDPALDMSGRLAPYMPSIHTGFRGVVSIYDVRDVFDRWEYLTDTAAIVGRGRDPESGEVTDTWFTGFISFDAPVAAVVVHLKGGEYPVAASIAGRDVISYMRQMDE